MAWEVVCGDEAFIQRFVFGTATLLYCRLKHIAISHSIMPHFHEKSLLLTCKHLFRGVTQPVLQSFEYFYIQNYDMPLNTLKVLLTINALHIRYRVFSLLVRSMFCFALLFEVHVMIKFLLWLTWCHQVHLICPKADIEVMRGPIVFLQARCSWIMKSLLSLYSLDTRVFCNDNGPKETVVWCVREWMIFWSLRFPVSFWAFVGLSCHLLWSSLLQLR